MELKPGQIYRHYKGNDYKIILLGTHSETEEEMAAYEQLYSGRIYFRPTSMFFNEVEWEGNKVQRFTLVSEG